MIDFDTEIVVGPCPCHECQEPLWWTGVWWVEANGLPHECGA